MCCARRLEGSIGGKRANPHSRHPKYDSSVDRVSIETELRRLVDDYRTTCLWFLREDYYPETPRERERVLRLIAEHGDLHAFRRVAQLRSWLSPDSSRTSVAS